MQLNVYVIFVKSSERNKYPIQPQTTQCIYGIFLTFVYSVSVVRMRWPHTLFYHVQYDILDINQVFTLRPY